MIHLGDPHEPVALQKPENKKNRNKILIKTDTRSVPYETSCYVVNLNLPPDKCDQG